MDIKDILDLFITTEYFNNMDIETRYLYFMYTMAGGMYYESYIRPWIRYVWITCTLQCTIAHYLCWSMVWYQKPEIDLSTIAFCVMSISCIIFIPLLSIIAYMQRKSLKYAIDRLHPQRKTHHTQIITTDPTYNETQYARYLLFINILAFAIGPAGACFGKLIKCLLVIETTADIDYIYDYLIPFPFITSPTMTQYVVIHVVQSIAAIPTVLICFYQHILRFYMLAFLKNQVVSLRRHMKLESDSTSQIIEQSYNDELATMRCKTLQNKKGKLQQISKQRESCYKNFTDHMKVTWIPRYQHIISLMKHMEKFIQTTSSITFVWLMIMLLTNIHIGIVERNMAYIYYSVISILLLLLLGIIGYLYEDMMDDLAAEIYELPWYWLPPKERKLILNFLCIVQKPLIIRFFNVFPISLPLLPRVCSNLYNYIQVMLLLDQRYRK